jgi:rubrerythrin
MELKGSKTKKNLETAFAQESKARNIYTYFADKAKQEGHGQIAEVFLEAADNEKEHARLLLNHLHGVDNTEANILKAAKGEHEEWSKTYPRFEKAAREEGFNEIADLFRRLAAIE